METLNSYCFALLNANKCIRCKVAVERATENNGGVALLYFCNYRFSFKAVSHTTRHSKDPATSIDHDKPAFIVLLFFTSCKTCIHSQMELYSSDMSLGRRHR